MIQLGQKARDSLTGFTGIVVARTEWLYGRVEVALQFQELTNGEPLDPQWFDANRLQLAQSDTKAGLKQEEHEPGGESGQRANF